MTTKNNQQLISTIFSLKRIIFDKIKRANLYEPRLHIQGETLFYIAENKNCQMKDIASFLKITPPSATSMINNLEKKGYIKRIRGEKDRRSIYLTLTEKGNKLIKNKRAKIENHMADILSPLNSKDQEALINIYNKLVKYHKK